MHSLLRRDCETNGLWWLCQGKRMGSSQLTRDQPANSCRSWEATRSQAAQRSRCVSSVWTSTATPDHLHTNSIFAPRLRIVAPSGSLAVWLSACLPVSLCSSVPRGTDHAPPVTPLGSSSRLGGPFRRRLQLYSPKSLSHARWRIPRGTIIPDRLRTGSGYAGVPGVRYGTLGLPASTAWPQRVWGVQ
jgi:hypothetical protein